MSVTPFEEEKLRMRTDIRKMLVLISAFTQKNTVGEDLLNEWNRKYN